jgi:hypothetical protein
MFKSESSFFEAITKTDRKIEHGRLRHSLHSVEASKLSLMLAVILTEYHRIRYKNLLLVWENKNLRIGGKEMCKYYTLEL